MALPQILADDRTGYGSSVPQVIGAARVPARCVFLADKRQALWARGPLGDVAAAQLVLCEGPITSVSKVWLDGKLEDAESVQATLARAVRFVYGGKIRFQDGTVPAEFTVGKVLKITGSGLRYGVDYPFDTYHKVLAVASGEITVGDPDAVPPGTAWDWEDLFDAPLQTQTAIVTPLFHYARALTAATDSLCGKDEWAELALGAPGQTAWSYLSKYDAIYRVPLAGTAHLRFSALIMPNGVLPDVECEVIGDGATGDGVSPGAAVKTLLARRLAASEIITDVGADGLAASSFDRYCAAQGWKVSAGITSETDVLESLENLLESTNAIPVPQGDGKLKIIPRGDQVVSGNGVTYTPPAVAVALGPDDFVADEGEDPIEIRRTSVADTFGVIPVAYEDRASHYERLTVRAPVVAVVDGSSGDEERVGDQFVSDWIKDAAHAKKISAILARRSTYVRNTFIFSVSHKGALLEPGDLVSLSEPVLGLVGAPARIVTIEEDGEGLLSIEAEEWSGTIDSTVSLSTQTADGLYGLPGELPPTAPSFPAEETRQIIEQAQQTANGALELAGSGTRVYHQAAPPTGDVPEGALWFSTDTTTDCPVSACKGHELDPATNEPRTGDYPHRGMYWPHRWSGTEWEDVERQALFVASEIATGAIVADKIGAGAVTAEKIAAQSITASMLRLNYGANLFPNGNSLVAPPAGASSGILDSAEFKYRTEVSAGSWRRRLANGQSIEHEVVCAEGDQHRASCHVSSAYGRMRMEWLNSAGTVLRTEYGTPVNSVVSLPALAASGDVVGALTAEIYAVKLRLVVYASGGSCDFNDISFFGVPVAAASGPYAPHVEVYAARQSATSRLRLADSGWIDAALNTGFANYANNGHPNTRYRKLAGRVDVQMATTRYQAVQDVFTLPAGYRPNGTVGFVGAHGANFMIGYVYSNGVVQIYGTVQNAQIASFSFPVDQ